MVPFGCLRFAIVVFPDHTHLLFCVSAVLMDLSKIVSEYDQEITQSQTADNPMAPRGRVTQPS